MAYNYSFMDNQVVGVDDLNGIAKRFVGSGVEDTFDTFASGTAYHISKFNGIAELLIGNGNSGAVPNGITTLQVTKGSGDKVNIAAGSAFFENGSTIDIVGGESLPFVAGQKNYVYLKSDTSQNRNFPACTTEAPTGDFVMLAEIDASGNVTDKRVYARGRVPSMYASNAGLPLVKELTFSAIGETQTVELGANNRYNWFVFVFTPSSSYGFVAVLTLLPSEKISYVSAGGGGYDVVNDENFTGNLPSQSDDYFSLSLSNNVLSLTRSRFHFERGQVLTVYAF